MKGMTGYARSKADNKRYEVVVEISSVNKRYLEISFRLPREYQQIEGDLRRDLSSKVFRGQVNIGICVRPIEAMATMPPINWAVIDGQLDLVRQISERLGCHMQPERIALELWRDQLKAEGERGEAIPEIEELISKGVAEAFAMFDRKRIFEGEFLTADLRKRAEALRSMKDQIARLTIGQVDQIRQRISEVLQKTVPSLACDDRVLREVVLYADKADVSEELSRIDHHLDHMEKVFHEKGAAGKLLEFILQELLREFNTLGAKTVIADVATLVVLAKTELEKMREQVQNVE
jgi:uncharacterized protein (TIGR00255 family)